MKVNIFWCRRDMRLEDNAALYYALKAGLPVIPLFIFDNEILNKLENKKDSRVTYIHNTLLQMQEQLKEIGSSMIVLYSTPEKAFKELIKEYSIENVFTNRDYEPYATERDNAIAAILKRNDTAFHLYKDHVILEQEEVLKDDGKPYTVFTPYSRKWKAVLTDYQFKSYPTEKYFENFFKTSPKKIPSLVAMGF